MEIILVMGGGDILMAYFGDLCGSISYICQIRYETLESE